MGEPTATIDEDDPSFVGALARGLGVIRAMGSDRESQTLSEIARSTGLPRATVRRSLLTLQALGYVASDGRQFRLTPRILSLGYAYLASDPLSRILQPVLERVSEATRESCSASTLDGGEIVYVARAATRRIMAVGLAVGSRLPAFCTSMGRVLLAAEAPERARRILASEPRRRLTPRTVTDLEALAERLAEVRQRDFAVVDEELEIGLRAIAVPVRNARGRVVAAMNVSAQAGRLSAGSLVGDVLPVLRAAALDVGPSLR
jgi:IclR family transcriptional regulator, pca regulon regulatory protein